MALTEEQIKELKKQLFEQVQNLPAEKKAEAEKQIENMSAEALELMLKQQQNAQSDSPRRNDVYRMIVEGVIQSRKIDENKEAIVVLDIRPIAKGHVIVIPKKQVAEAKNLSNSALSLAKNIARRISVRLKAKGAEIQTEKKFGEVVINVIPVYEKEVSINSPRYEASETELNEVFSKLNKIGIKKVEKIKIKKASQEGKVLQLKKRIP